MTTLPEEALLQAHQVARARGMPVTSLLEATLLNYLEALEDLEEARRSSNEIQSGTVTPIPWETIKARQKARHPDKNTPTL